YQHRDLVPFRQSVTALLRPGDIYLAPRFANSLSDMSADQLVPNAGHRNAEKILHPDPFSARVKLFSALLISSAVIAYFPAINAGFIWDDASLLTANPQMQSEHGLKEIWLGKNT